MIHIYKKQVEYIILDKPDRYPVITWLLYMMKRDEGMVYRYRPKLGMFIRN